MTNTEKLLLNTNNTKVSAALMDMIDNGDDIELFKYRQFDNMDNYMLDGYYNKGMTWKTYMQSGHFDAFSFLFIKGGYIYDNTHSSSESRTSGWPIYQRFSDGTIKAVKATDEITSEGYYYPNTDSSTYEE